MRLPSGVTSREKYRLTLKTFNTSLGLEVRLSLKLKSMSQKKRKKSALIISRHRKRFWTTQKQFWQWSREGIVVKTNDYPLTGTFVRDDDETLVVIQKMVLNFSNPVHLREVLASKQLMKSKRN
jgi:hypothetical protein